MAKPRLTEEDKAFLRNVNKPERLDKKLTVADREFLKNANNAGFFDTEIVRAARRQKRCAGASDVEIRAYVRHLQDKYLSAISGEPTPKLYRR